jgi:hypothetical protein
VNKLGFLFNLFISFEFEIIESTLKSGSSFEEMGLNQAIDFGIAEMPFCMTPFYELFRSEDEVTEGTIKLLDLFLKYGMNINVQRSDGNNLLTMLGYGIAQVRRDSSRDTRINIAKFLIKSGINAKKKNIYGQSFIDILNYDQQVKDEYKMIMPELVEMISHSSFPKQSKNVIDDEKATLPTAKIDYQQSNEDIIEQFYKNATILEEKKGRMLAKYSNKSKNSKVIVPSDIKIVGANAFQKCNYIEEIILSEGVEEIRANAFIDCENLSKVIFPTTLR